MSDWYVNDPPEFVDLEIPHLSHERWQSLTLEQQTSGLREELLEFLGAG